MFPVSLSFISFLSDFFLFIDALHDSTVLFPAVSMFQVFRYLMSYYLPKLG